MCVSGVVVGMFLAQRREVGLCRGSKVSAEVLAPTLLFSLSCGS